MAGTGSGADGAEVGKQGLRAACVHQYSGSLWGPCSQPTHPWVLATPELLLTCHPTQDAGQQGASKALKT